MATIKDDYINRKNLAKLLGERLRGKPYCVNTLMMWERDGYGPPVTRIGREVTYSVTSVERWLKAQEKATAA